MAIPDTERDAFPAVGQHSFRGAGLVGSRSPGLDPPFQASEVARAERHLPQQRSTHQALVSLSTAMIKPATPVGLSAASPTYLSSIPPMLLPLINISSLT